MVSKPQTRLLSLLDLGCGGQLGLWFLSNMVSSLYREPDCSVTCLGTEGGEIPESHVGSTLGTCGCGLTSPRRLLSWKPKGFLFLNISSQLLLRTLQAMDDSFSFFPLIDLLKGRHLFEGLLSSVPWDFLGTENSFCIVPFPLHRSPNQLPLCLEEAR